MQDRGPGAAGPVQGRVPATVLRLHQPRLRRVVAPQGVAGADHGDDQARHVRAGAGRLRRQAAAAPHGRAGVRHGRHQALQRDEARPDAGAGIGAGRRGQRGRRDQQAPADGVRVRLPQHLDRQRQAGQV